MNGVPEKAVLESRLEVRTAWHRGERFHRAEARRPRGGSRKTNMDINRKEKCWPRSPLSALLVWCEHGMLLGILLLWSTVLAGSGVAHQPARNSNGFTYSHGEDKSVPWSMHVVKIERGRADL